jgi:predicted nucleotidyltransferase
MKRAYPRVVGEMVKRIVRQFAPERIILFGSQATGRAAPDSDVDLLVVMPLKRPKPEQELAILKALRRYTVPKDIVVTTPEDFAWRSRVPGTIERPAAREGRVLYAKR